MENISLDRRIAQLFMVGFSGCEAYEQLTSLIEKHGFTSFIVFQQNLRDFETLCSMVGEARKTAERLGLAALLFAADEEGGLISPLGAAVGRLPSAMGLSAGGSEARARHAAYLVGIGLKDAGLDLVLAPVLDVNNEPDNPVIGTRSFGDDAQLVASMGAAVLDGYHSAGLACCIKHFPGHGSTKEDSHKCLPVIDSTMEQLRFKEFPPFRAAFERGAEAVMTAHVAYPSVDGEALRPSTLSPKILTDILRKQMGFKGTVISDSIEMAGLSGYMPGPEACVEALKAGVDLLICVDPGLAVDCAAQVSKSLEAGEIGDEVIESALRNIECLKAASRGNVSESLESALQDGPADPESILSECYTASLTLLGLDPQRLKERVGTVEKGALLLPDGLPGYEETDIAFVESVLANLGVTDRWRVISYPFNPTDADVFRLTGQVGDSEGVIFCGLSRGPAPKGQRRFCETMARRGKLRVGVALLDPYEAIWGLPTDLPRVATYGYWPECLAALLDLLFGLGGAPGAMPVQGVSIV